VAVGPARLRDRTRLFNREHCSSSGIWNRADRSEPGNLTAFIASVNIAHFWEMGTIFARTQRLPFGNNNTVCKRLRDVQMFTVFTIFATPESSGLNYMVALVRHHFSWTGAMLYCFDIRSIHSHLESFCNLSTIIAHPYRVLLESSL
jgi:hypothetical protein